MVGQRAGYGSVAKQFLHTDEGDGAENRPEQGSQAAQDNDHEADTGGGFFNAEDEAALAGVYREIDAATTADVRTESWRPRRSLAHWPAGLIGFILLAASGFLLLRVAREARAA